MKTSDMIYALCVMLFDFAVMYLLLDIKLKKAKRFKLVLSIIAFTLSLLSGIMIAGIYDRSTFTSYYFPLVQLPIFIVYFLLSRYRRAKLFFVYLSTFIFSALVLWFPYIVGAFVNYSTNIMVAAFIIAYILMLVIVKRSIAPLFHYALENLHNNWLLLCALPITYTLLSMLSGGSDYSLTAWQETSYFRVLFLSIICSAYLIIFIFFKQISEQLRMKNEQALLTLQMNSMQTHLSELKNSQTLAAIYRHDLRHHLQYVNSCLSQSDYAELSNYIKSICSEIEQSIVQLYCENDSANMIISSYIAKAKGMETDIVVDAIIPAAIHITTTDLCVVLANGIENAIHACEKMGDKAKKIIQLCCYIKNEKLFIRITNPYDGVVEFQDDIPVAEAEGHGIGTKSIVNIAKKYNGIYSFTAKESLFTLSIII